MAAQMLFEQTQNLRADSLHRGFAFVDDEDDDDDYAMERDSHWPLRFQDGC